MASLPSADDIRNFLEDYCISSSIISDTWINNRITNFIVPYIEKKTRSSFTGVKEITDYYSGNGDNVLVLHSKNVTEIVNIQFVVGGGVWVFNLSNVELISDEGLIKAKRNFQETWIKPYFPKGDKNIKITYKVGYASNNIPSDIYECIIYLASEQMLGQIEGRSGGGDISVEGYSKNYGERGKFTHIRNDLGRKGYAIIKNYFSTVV